MTTQRDDLESVVAEITEDNLHDALYYDHIDNAARLILDARRERDTWIERMERCAADNAVLEAERDAARQEAEDCHAKWRDEAEKRQEALAALDEAQRQGAENARLREAFEEHQRDGINHGEWQALYDACWNALAPKPEGGE